MRVYDSMSNVAVCQREVLTMLAAWEWLFK